MPRFEDRSAVQRNELREIDLASEPVFHPSPWSVVVLVGLLRQTTAI